MRLFLKIALGIIASLLIFLGGLTLGHSVFSPLELWQWITGGENIFLDLRFYRIVSAFVVGSALASSGVAYQAVLHNPLAEPYILGISSGAGLGATIALVGNLTALGVVFLPISAFTGAVVMLGVVLLIANQKGRLDAMRMLLSGVIVGTVCSSLMMFIINVLGASKYNSVTWWLLGNLESPNSGMLLISICTVGAGGLILWLMGRHANLISLGEEMAHNMGISPRRTIFILLIVSSLMSAVVVAMSGIIGFVGLIVPHILRGFIGADHRKLFPMSMLCGGLFLIVCDLISRSVYSVQEIPIGVITSLIGGPIFLWMLLKGREQNG